ncbi:hypothetical protein Tco_1192627 [Tanacetum coccineum]
MANLDFCDKHNMVAYLQKSEGSEGFHQIVDFLNTCHIKYALIENPTIYVSLIEQFWQTASASTLENGDMEITATIDGKVKVVSEASIRRHLKLEDSDGISTLPTTEIFEQLALMGNMKRALKGYTGVDTPLFQTMLVQSQILQGEGSTIPVESHHTPISAPSTSQPPTSPPSMQTTHVAEEAANMPHDSPIPGGHTLGSDKGSMTLNELTVLCTQLSTKVVSLEADLKQTKKFTAPEEDYTTKPDISTANVPVSTSGAEVSTASPEVRTAAESLVYIKRSAAKRKDKGKALMKEAEPVQKKTKLQLEQEMIGLEEALRLQEQLDEEEWQRIAIVQEEASTFNTEEWDKILAQIKVDEELAHRLQAQEREGYSEADKARLLVELINERKRKFAQIRAEQRRNKPMTQAQQRTYMCNYIKHMGSHTLQQLKKFPLMKSRREGSEPAKESKDELSQEQLQQLMIIVPEEGMNVEALQTKYPIIDWEVYTEDSRMYMHDPLKWKLYDTCGVHHVSIERGHDIFMLVEKDYPLTRALMTLMLCNKLQVDEYSVMADELLRKIFILANRSRHMRMKQYLTHTDYAFWEVIVNGDAFVVASASAEGSIPPKTAEQKLARKNEFKAKSTLLLAIPDASLQFEQDTRDYDTIDPHNEIS